MQIAQGTTLLPYPGFDLEKLTPMRTRLGWLVLSFGLGFRLAARDLQAIRNGALDASRLARRRASTRTTSEDERSERGPFSYLVFSPLCCELTFVVLG